MTRASLGQAAMRLKFRFALNLKSESSPREHGCQLEPLSTERNTPLTNSPSTNLAGDVMNKTYCLSDTPPLKSAKEESAGMGNGIRLKVKGERRESPLSVSK